ncbi:CRAL-TRIO lipid binding domain [Dillenia turbinata]|uniref:CRAL-TRIO lipid binding domain n=1 Tax=Dillenia turbinata TaxID=194707 RepID=A0AAN8WEM2_9MAGN
MKWGKYEKERGGEKGILRGCLKEILGKRGERAWARAWAGQSGEREREREIGSSSSDDFSVVVLASDLGIGHRPFLSPSEREEEENWHDCPSYLSDEDFSDLEALQFFRLQGSDKYATVFFVSSANSSLEFDVFWIMADSRVVKGANLILLILGFLSAPVISGERLKKYVFHKIYNELPEGPFCIVYLHSTVQKEDNSPGMIVLRWIYEDLPSNCKDRLQLVYFVHPGLHSRLVLATLGCFFLSGGLYWKIKYVSRLQYLWEDIRKEEIEIPEFVQNHDDVLEHRPLTDYGIEPEPLHLTEIPSTVYSFGMYEERWREREYMS